MVSSICEALRTSLCPPGGVGSCNHQDPSDKIFVLENCIVACKLFRPLRPFILPRVVHYTKMLLPLTRVVRTQCDFSLIGAMNFGPKGWHQGLWQSDEKMGECSRIACRKKGATWASEPRSRDVVCHPQTDVISVSVAPWAS